MVRKTKEELGLAENEPLPSPWTVEIEPTLICDARCHFCSYKPTLSSHKEQLRSSHVDGIPIENGLSRDIVMNLLRELKRSGTTRGIFWSGGGEPLLWPYIVEETLEAAAFADVSIQTNGINLDKFTEKPEYLASVRLLTVSVVAHNQNLHREVAGVRSFERLIENIKRAIGLRNRFGMGLVIGSKVLVSQRNYHYLPEIVKYYREYIGTDIVGIRLVQDYNYGGEGPREESVELTQEQKKELLSILQNVATNDPALAEFQKILTLQMRKPVPSSRCFNAIDGHFACVDPQGNVFLGNPEIGNPQFSIGNLYQKNWSEIWGSKYHHKVALLMDKLQQKGDCSSELCRHVRANHGVDRYLKGGITSPSYNEVMRDLGAFL
ncbi:MAG: radical SAM protein [Patescibacteria group bacterium]